MPNHGESVAECRQWFAIPAHALDYRSTLNSKLAGPQCHEGEQGEQRGRGAQDSQVGPLPLGFDAEVPSGFFEGGFGSPAPYEPAQDVGWLGRLVSA